MSASRDIFISAAEDSADVHGATLLRAAQQSLPHAHFYGVCGPRMQAAGAEALTDLTQNAVMLGGVITALPRAVRLARALEQNWRNRRPAAVILLDSPELHLGLMELGLKGLAPRAAAQKIPVIYYIAPQTWATRSWRNRWIRKYVTHLACILPFEADYFARHGVHAEFVGHPLFESLKLHAPHAETVARLKSAARGRPLIALMPGSRRHVIETMLPLQLQTLKLLRSYGVAEASAAISCVSSARFPLIERIRAAHAVEAEIITADNASLLSAADLVLVASGTATLEVGYYRKPMVVMYDAGGLVRAVYENGGDRLVRTPHLSLINILANARVVPEFMPFIDDVEPVARVLGQLLGDASWRTLMIAQIDSVIRPLEQRPASANLCRLIAETVGAV